jgi:hypothetical protein
MIELKIDNRIFILQTNPEIEIETYDGEIFIFNPVTDNICVLNVTSAFIFNYIVNAINDGKEELCCDLIRSSLKEVFQMDKQDEDDFNDDIKSLIDGLLKEQVLYEL